MEPEEHYEQYYSDDGFRGKLKRFAGMMGKEAVKQALTLYYLTRDPNVPKEAKLIVFGALGYLIFPADLIPDLIPGVGFSDDLGALVITISTLSKHITSAHREKAKQLVDKWFGDKEQIDPLKDDDVIDI